MSLRELAAAIGTSHRMLIYHFGSREGLLVEVVRAVEAHSALVRGSARRHRGLPGDAMRAMWRRVADPTLWPNERLFFELYGQALQGGPARSALLDDIVDAWVEPSAHSLRPGPAGGQGPRRGAARRRGRFAGCCSTCSRPAIARP